LIDQLPPLSVLIGDRNFGVFAVAWRAHQRGHKVLVRLTEARARRLSAGELTPGNDEEVMWEPSRDDRRAHPDLPAGACLQGRLIVARTEAEETLYLFTSLHKPAGDVVSLYKERWNNRDRSALAERTGEIAHHRSSFSRSGGQQTVHCRRQLQPDSRCHGGDGAGHQHRSQTAQLLTVTRSILDFCACRRVRRVRGKIRLPLRLLLRSFSQSELPKRHRPPAPCAVWPKPQNFPIHKVQKP
jgi:hypothetical protein